MEPAHSAQRLTDPDALIAALMAGGWRVIGPKRRDGAIVPGVYRPGERLPKGLTDEQSGGHYRLQDGDPERWFDYVVGPQGPKGWLFPARQKLWSAERTDDGFNVTEAAHDWPKTAFVGLRACEIAAIGIHDRVFGEGPFRDAGYAARRAGVLIVAVNCARSAPTCFCASAGTGPRAETGHDIALTEMPEGGLIAEAATEAGAAILAGLDGGPVDPAAALAVSAAAAAAQTRSLPAGIAPILAAAHDHPRWAEVAERCLGCGNCTAVCPTCFCSDTEEVSDLSNAHAERWRHWDSCFSIDFSYIHGGAVRRSGEARYRQWMTHKLSHWIEQFGTSGCVGCGRCITWCPVGIDITEEAAAIAAAPGGG